MALLYVARGPYRLHPDPRRVDAIIAGLARNQVRHGAMYCPCMPIEESLARGAKNVCPCEAHHRDIAQGGCCECAFFVSPEYAARAGAPTGQA
ncbi:MAG: ferredoxin:thioredoxin reductase [Planctomycetes bacterium]|nr:ferredoxin:thioredoxin reductase [Planctomycetota bacterium]